MTTEELTQVKNELRAGALVRIGKLPAAQGTSGNHAVADQAASRRLRKVEAGVCAVYVYRDAKAEADGDFHLDREATADQVRELRAAGAE